MISVWWHTASELRWRHAWSVWNSWLKWINVYICHETAARMRHATSRTHFVGTFFFSMIQFELTLDEYAMIHSKVQEVASKVKCIGIDWNQTDAVEKRFSWLMFFNYPLHYRRLRFGVIAPIAISLRHYFFLGIEIERSAASFSSLRIIFIFQMDKLSREENK